jgi:hypothetical protein
MWTGKARVSNRTVKFHKFNVRPAPGAIMEPNFSYLSHLGAIGGSRGREGAESPRFAKRNSLSPVAPLGPFWGPRGILQIWELPPAYLSVKTGEVASVRSPFWELSPTVPTEKSGEVISVFVHFGVSTWFETDYYSLIMVVTYSMIYATFSSDVIS